MTTPNPHGRRGTAVLAIAAAMAFSLAAPAATAQPDVTAPDGFVAYVDIPDATSDAQLPGPTLVDGTFTVHVSRVAFDDDGDGQYEEHHDFGDANEGSPGDYDCDEGGLVAILVSIQGQQVETLDSEALGADCEATFDVPTGTDGPDGVGEGFAVTIWTPTSQDGSDQSRLSSYFAAKNRVGPASADILDVSTRQPAFTSFTPIFDVTAA